MAYIPTDWAKGDVIGEAQLDKIEAQLARLSNGGAFQLSGSVGGTAAASIPAGASTRFQTVGIAVPAGGSLVLEQARFSLPGAGGLRLRIEGYPAGTYWFESASAEGEETPDTVLADAAGGAGTVVALQVQVSNPTAGALTIFPYAAWWLSLSLQEGG